jgi:nucleoside-diphosphate-sugar epimerase
VTEEAMAEARRMTIARPGAAGVSLPMRGVRAVVTGSAGFVGGHLVRQLADAGADVVGLDRRDPALDAPGRHHRVELTAPGARDVVADELVAADIVFHLAGRAGVRDSGPEVDSDRRRDNGLAAVTVLGLTPRRTPLLVTSSSSVYGGARTRGGRPIPSHERDPLHPRGGYARSKVLVERLCGQRRARGGLVTVVRPFTVAGPGQRPDMAIGRWLAAARAGTPARVLGSLARRRDTTDVRQVARALVELAAHPDLDVVNIGTGRPVALADVLAAVVGAVGRPIEVALEPPSVEEPALTCADPRRLARHLGWVPETDLDELVRAQLAPLSAPAADLHSQMVSANMA